MSESILRVIIGASPPPRLDKALARDVPEDEAGRRSPARELSEETGGEGVDDEARRARLRESLLEGRPQAGSVAVERSGDAHNGKPASHAPVLGEA